MGSNDIKLTKNIAKKLLPKRKVDSNKGTYGKVLNIAGCYNYEGAALFSSLAPLKVGAGLVTLASTKQVINNLSSSLPWVTFYPLNDSKEKCISEKAFNEIQEIINNYDVISIGAGLSTEPEVSTFVEKLIEYLNLTDKKTVIDADALNIIATSTITKLPQNSIITPHPMEMSRLLKTPIESIQNNRKHYAKLCAQKFGCNVILKGHKTIITNHKEKTYENTTGNSALAKAGSGDVLTGMIAGFSAQGLSVFDAGLLSVYLHGLCGELASKKYTEYCVLATDQITYIPKAIKKLI